MQEDVLVRAVPLRPLSVPRAVPLPRMVRVVQEFATPGPCDVEAEVRRQVGAPEIARRIPRGGRVAVGVGSRGIAEVARITAAVVAALRSHGASPFVVPAMGSHGGATPQGQRAVLESLGISEATVDAPIVSSLETVELGQLADGTRVHWDKASYEAGAAVIIGRVKPHTAFRGPVESGLVKMAVIGMGKHRGAEALHRSGFGGFADRLLEAWDVVRQRAPLLFGVAVVEDAYDVPVRLQVLPSERIRDEEPALLDLARRLMPRLPCGMADVLVLQEIGKNISGDGMDPNITGRYPTPYASGGPVIHRIAVLDLTPETHGNANGVGLADFIAQRVLEKIDLQATYTNALTSTVVGTVRLPMVLRTDRDVLSAAVSTSPARDPLQARIVYVRNTLAMREVAVSEPALAVLEPHARPVSDPFPLAFTPEGALVPPLAPAGVSARGARGGV